MTKSGSIWYSFNITLSWSAIMLLDSVLINFIRNCIYVWMSLLLCMTMYTWAYAFMLLESVLINFIRNCIYGYLDISVLTWTSRYSVLDISVLTWTVRDLELDETIFGTDDLLIKGLSYQNKSYLQILMNCLFDFHLIKDD
jgi:hypothetical protein